MAFYSRCTYSKSYSTVLRDQLSEMPNYLSSINKRGLNLDTLNEETEFESKCGRCATGEEGSAPETLYVVFCKGFLADKQTNFSSPYPCLLAQTNQNFMFCCTGQVNHEIACPE